MYIGDGGRGLDEVSVRGVEVYIGDGKRSLAEVSVRGVEVCIGHGGRCCLAEVFNAC